MENSDTLKEIDKYLTGWSGGINPRTFAAMKDKIKVISINHHPIGYLHLETLTEQRIVYPSIKPKGGGDTADLSLKYEFPEDVDVWHVQMHDVPDDFSEGAYTREVPHATRIVACHNCRGTGEIHCRSCGATGSINCTHCAGTGVLMCHQCEGSGIKMCSTCDGKGTTSVEKVREWMTNDGDMQKKSLQILESCAVCQGKGTVPCSACHDGSVSCSYCDGVGRTPCDDCKGIGMLSCEVCEGKKMLMSTLIIKQKFLKKEDSLVFVSPDLTRRFNEYPFRINLKQNPGTHYFNTTYEGGITSNDYTSFAPESFMSKYDRVNLAYEFFKMNLPKKSSEQITRQRVTFFEADCVVIKYLFEQEIYEFMVDTHNMRYAAPYNPFIRIVKTLVSEAELAFDQKKYGKAYDLASEAYNQYETTEDAPDIARLISRIRKAMNQHYLFGLGGGLMVMILFKFMSLISFGMAFVYILLPILMTALVGFLFMQVAHKHFIRSDAVRLGIGIASSVLLYLLLTLFY